MWHYGVTQSQHCNNDNNYNESNDKAMHVNIWFEFFGVLLYRQNPPWYMGWKHDNKEQNLSWEHPFPRVSRYKRRRDINEEVDITELRVCLHIAFVISEKCNGVPPTHSSAHNYCTMVPPHAMCHVP